MIELIQQRLERYRVTNPLEEEQATKEILQEVQQLRAETSRAAVQTLPQRPRLV
jgi:hypothetical protein